MASKTVLGQYCAQAVIGVTESGANTLTFAKLETGLSVYDKVGWVLNRVEWRPSLTAYSQFNSSGDSLTLALTASSNLSGLSDGDPAIYAIQRFLRVDLGTPASGAVIPIGEEDDYSTFPGGGILVLPNPLYLAALGSGLAAATTSIVRIWYTAIDMADADYFNLVQGRQILINS